MNIKLPHNTNAEKAILGAMLISSESLVDALGSLTVEDFYSGNRKHQIVFQAIRNVQNARRPVDFQTVAEELINLKELDNIGGIEFLLDLSNSAISFSNLDFYVKIVQEQALLRNLLLTMGEVIEEYETEKIDSISDFIADADRRISKIAEKRRISDFRTSKEITARVEEQMKLLSKANESGVTGVTTGYTKLNTYTHGFQRGNMIILAARPSVGKTALAINIALNAASKDHKPVAIFSLEMPAEQLIMRLIANQACVELDKIQTNILTSEERAKVRQGIANVANTPIYIDDTPGIRLMDIIAKAKKLKSANEEVSMIVIDYIGLITTGAKKVESRQLEVSEISRTLKELARELKVPVLVIAQLSRAVEQRDNKRPMLSDLRESGSIEQDADVVLMLYRNDYYSATGQKTKGPRKTETNAKSVEYFQEQEKKVIEQSAPGSGDASLVEVIVAKNRNGKIGKLPLIFFKSYGRFDNISPELESRMNEMYENAGVDIED